MEEKFIIEENKKLCSDYPFLIPKNRWTGDIVKDYDYTWTELDGMPDGWKKAFGENLCREIKNVLNQIDKDYNKKISADYRITQVKEKYGELCWYTNWSTKELDEVIQKYKDLSIRTCFYCGAQATKISTDYILPYCDICVEKTLKEYSHLKFINLDEYLERIEK